MVQGTTCSIELWIQKDYEIAKDIALGKGVTPEQTSIAAHPADKKCGYSQQYKGTRSQIND